jgi:tetratricopeptide (TPR) repeat protein
MGHSSAAHAASTAPGRGSAHGSARWSSWAALVLAAATVAVFAPACGHDFINYDDPGYITENVAVKTGLTMRALGWAFTSTALSNWHPMTWLSLQLDATLYGVDPRGYHLSNVLLHAANSGLLLVALAGMTGSPARSALAAAIFAWHPLRVESVAWAAERKDVLSGLFFMLCLSSYVRYARRPRPATYACVALALALGLLAKPMLVTVPVVLLLLDLWPLHRLEQGARARVLEKLPLVVLATAACAVTLWAQAQGGAVGSLHAFPWPDRVANAAVAYVSYLREMLWPVDLVIFQPYAERSWSDWRVLAAVVLLAVISTLAASQLRRRPYLAVCWGWYVVMLAPVIGLVQVGDQAMADRYTYLPSIAVGVALVWAGADLCSRWAALVAAALGVAAGVLVACVLATEAQLTYWRDSVSLWQRAVDHAPPSATAQWLLGAALAERRPRRAASHLQAALVLDPRSADAHYNLGLVLDRLGSAGAAQEHYRAALRVKPNYWQAHVRLALALRDSGEPAAARQHFEAAAEIEPRASSAHTWIAITYADENRWRDAIQSYERAIAINPSDAVALDGLAAAYARIGDFPSAVTAAREALRQARASGRADLEPALRQRLDGYQHGRQDAATP